MMRTIAIIGAGQLGSRHLQALVNLKLPKKIFVVDTSGESLRTSAQRWKEVEGRQDQVDFFPSIEKLPSEIDLAIIATSSAMRRPVIEQLVDHSRITFMILEKFLFQTEKDFIDTV